jgi:O-antigen/teichoic acid export membrane protein
MLRRARDGRSDDDPRRGGGGRTASAGLLVAVGTGIGNVLAYGFNLVLSRGLGPGGYAELGTLLSVFLIGTVPGMAVQAVNARRLAVAADAAEGAALVRGLRRRGLAVGAGVAALFVALAPAIAALLPSVTVGGVAWTGVSLAANTVFGSYLGIAQGMSRFVTMTALYLAAQGSRLAIGAVAASAQTSPTTVMAAQTAAWALAALAGRWLLRGAEAPAGDSRASGASGAPGASGASVASGPPGASGEGAYSGYLTEVLRATGGLGGILLLTVLDTLLASRYLTDGDLGRYNTGALVARAAFFAPSFVAMLAYPRLARPAERRRALLVSLALTAGMGALGVALAGFGGNPLIRAAFGAKYATPAGFDLGTHSWLFASVGALLAVVNLALLDGVARRSHVVSMVVLGGIALEITVIVGFAHGSAGAIVTAAAACTSATAAVAVTVCLTARTGAATTAPTAGLDDAQAVRAVPQTST